MPSPGPKPEWWVYILRCGDDTLYTGIATDVDGRLSKHQAGRGAKYTRGRGVLVVVYRELVGCRSEASRRELAIKKLSRRAKNLLIENGLRGDRELMGSNNVGLDRLPTIESSPRDAARTQRPHGCPMASAK
ncbi:GIY-YIG nuclease family protein [Holophaga foetida]|uniref:GIY-YIG nuclease family protein n=1 Tax=Holophaga foetida TaxID=35839 RepID=UPI0002473EE2|nr:GIY-YIG nuclease family protein [Holophaga foetida]